MIKLGITGGIGSGKSTVSEIFSLCGVPVYIADVESKRLVSTSPLIKEKLIVLFGEDLYKNNVLDKALLASHIFNNKDKLEKVNAIIHPEVKKDYERWLDKNKHHKIVAQEAAILFESGFNKLMDKVVMVYTPLELRIQRTMVRDNVSYEKVLERIQNQMPDEEKVKLSDFVIVNDGAGSLIEQVQNVIQQLENSCI
ncbi:MAG: dephospho-CoA kinase [Dysgonomonas sp.]